ncbi:MAG: AAA family ATPase, partial [Candidatus Caldarchaeum sp.]
MREDIERYNEWWFTGKVRRELVPEYRRRDYAKLLKALQNRQIVIITGLRRVGKSTLMYQAIDHLLETTPPQQILYFSFDEEKHDPKQILKIYEREVLKKPFEEAGKIYVFLDEIQNVDGWTAAVKQFYDLYPSVKFVLSGSSTLLLSVEAVHKLAGRFTTLKVKPLTFVEFL